MEKIFFSALAALSLVACVQEAVVDTPQGDAIAFENAFVDNATRAESLTATNLDAFNVYGIVNNTSGVVFDGTVVSKRDGAWKYDGVKYWIPGQDYYFAALAPVTTNWTLDTEAATTAGPGVLTFNNNGEEDLIYAKAYQQALSSGNQPVGFTFNHLLSKVKFSFTEGFEEEYINVNIKNITLAAPGTASIDLTQSTLSWADYGTKVPYAYGELSGLSATAKATDDLFIIPGCPEYTITFDVVVWQTGEYGKKQVFKKNATVEGLTFEIGKAYNLTAAINPVTLALETIEFNVNEVEDWSNGGSTQIFPATPVATAEEFAQALEEGAENVVLTGDITLAGLETKAAKTAGLTITRDIVIDGNGHTLTYEGSDRAIDVPAGSDVNVTIKNVNLVLTSSYCERGINYNNGGTLTLDNVKVSETGTAATYALNLPGSSDNCNVIIKDSYLRGNIALNVWGENIVINATNTTFVSYDNSTSEGYTAVKLNNNGTTKAEGTIINIEGGKIIALNENGEASSAFSNATETGKINISESTEVNGSEFKTVAIVKYVGTDNFYSCASLERAFELSLQSENTTIMLMSDIELTEPWEPVGTEEKPFNGTFDGNNYTISGLSVTGDYAAFIAYAGKYAVVKNVAFENVKVESSKYGAAVICVAGNNVTVEKVTVSGAVNAKSYAAGLVLINNEDSDKVVIKNCVNNANVTSNRAGGVAAWLTGGSVIENVVNNGEITGSISACGITNRIAGTITNAKNYGKISGHGPEASSGIAGTLKAATTFEYCYNYGNVTTSADDPNASAAGILGQTPGGVATLNYCANYGTITAEQSYAAGIAYSLYGNTISSYCYNAGNVEGADGAGAIAPKAQYGTADKAMYCLNAGVVVSANGKVYQGSNNNTSCYYYSEDALLNVKDNSVVSVEDAIAVLNGGANNTFFTTENGKIIVK